MALGGGSARGLAHIGVLDVLEREGLHPAFIAGSSMGGLIGALSASGLAAREIADMARSFRFPRWFVPGATAQWRAIFPAAAQALSGRQFADLRIPLVLAATDLEEGSQAVLAEGPVLSAVEATCAVPGVLPPVRRDGRWLVDGGLVNILPVDLASMADPDLVVAVKIGARRIRRMPQLNWNITAALSFLGRVLPNPATSKLAFELLVRAAEIALDRATMLAVAMAGPEAFIEVDVGDVGLRDFDRLEEAVDAGRRAAEAALPSLKRLVTSTSPSAPKAYAFEVHVDPVCGMTVSERRARARTRLDGVPYLFCSVNCLECFEREPARYVPRSART